MPPRPPTSAFSCTSLASVRSVVHRPKPAPRGPRRRGLGVGAARSDVPPRRCRHGPARRCGVAGVRCHRVQSASSGARVRRGECLIPSGRKPAVARAMSNERGDGAADDRALHFTAPVLAALLRLGSKPRNGAEWDGTLRQQLAEVIPATSQPRSRADGAVIGFASGGPPRRPDQPQSSRFTPFTSTRLVEVEVWGTFSGTPHAWNCEGRSLRPCTSTHWRSYAFALSTNVMAE